MPSLCGIRAIFRITRPYFVPREGIDNILYFISRQHAPAGTGEASSPSHSSIEHDTYLGTLNSDKVPEGHGRKASDNLNCQFSIKLPSNESPVAYISNLASSGLR